MKIYKVHIDAVLMPVTPGKITTKIKNRNKSLDLLEGGEINLLKDPGLTEIKFELLLPNVQYPFAEYVNGYKGADYYLSKFEDWKRKKQPVYFSVSRLNEGGRLLYDSEPLLVSVEDYEIVEEFEDGADVRVNVSLKQYQKTGLIKLTLQNSQKKTDTKTAVKSTAVKRPAPTPVKTYKVVSGDTLWIICRKQLGDGNKYKTVAKLNNISNPNKLTVGKVIRLV